MEHVFAEASHFVYERMQSVVKLPEWWPSGGMRRFNGLCRQLDALIVRVIEQHRRDRPRRHDAALGADGRARSGHEARA